MPGSNHLQYPSSEFHNTSFLSSNFLFLGGGGLAVLSNSISGIGGTISLKNELFKLKPLFVVLINLMTNQSNAQFTIGCITVESPNLQ